VRSRSTASSTGSATRSSVEVIDTDATVRSTHR
jgi:hypothetical protein